MNWFYILEQSFGEIFIGREVEINNKSGKIINITDQDLTVEYDNGSIDIYEFRYIVEYDAMAFN
jgi:hypothetical protein